MKTVIVASLVVLMVNLCQSMPATRGQLLTDIVKDLEAAIYDLKVYVDLEESSSSKDVRSLSDLAVDGREQNSDSEDVSLREAVDFLVGLAKKNKQQQRDHDIPFPFNNPPKPIK